MKAIKVDTGQRPYEVLVGGGLLARLGELEGLAGKLEGRKVLVATDKNVERLYGDALKESLSRAGARVAGLAAMEPGEVHKTIQSASLFWDALVEAEMERRDLLVALGGGVVGDVAGFAASAYLRGIDFVQVPTTLLAMVDSSVGGKTGVDHPKGKNLIGAFHQPRAVVADLELLKTLPRREVLSGLAEVIKAAILADAELFDLLEIEGPGIVDNPAALAEAVARAVAVKAAVVGRDEREGGERALLNLGHTLGHAVENAMGYGGPTHGEAVALGMVFAARLSLKLGRIEPEAAGRIEGLIRSWGYPSSLDGLPADKIRTAFRFDKKRSEGVTRWVLPLGIGRAEWGQAVNDETVDALLAEV